jgi:hypothetical protein
VDPRNTLPRTHKVHQTPGLASTKPQVTMPAKRHLTHPAISAE